MKDEKLFTPGPTKIPESIMRAMQVSAIHHRSDIFKNEVTQVLEGLTWLLGRKETPILLACSGTGAMEAAIGSVTKIGDSIVTVNAGAFGERWRRIGEALGLSVSEVTAEWGNSPSLDQCIEVLQRAPQAKAFCIQQCETSTTVTHPLKMLLPKIKEQFPNVLCVVDGISAFATEEIPGNEDVIDIYIAGSQKGLMLPAGLSIVSLNAAAWSIAEATPPRSLYFDLRTERKALQKQDTAWTPATHIILGLNAALKLIREEGKENVFGRHARISAAIQAGLRALELKPVTEHFPSVGISGFYPPDSISAEDIRSTLLLRFGVRTAEGQGILKGKIVRIGHMGVVNEFDALGILGVLELSLVQYGGKNKFGLGITAALHELADH